MFCLFATLGKGKSENVSAKIIPALLVMVQLFLTGIQKGTTADSFIIMCRLHFACLAHLKMANFQCEPDLFYL